MVDRMNAAEAAQKEREQQAVRDDKSKKMWQMVTECGGIFKKLGQLDKQIRCSEDVLVKPDGSCVIIVTLDDSKLAHPKKKVAEKRIEFFLMRLIDLKNYMRDQAEQQKLQPFTFTIQGKDGGVLGEVKVP